jgi:hypothetical protein
MGCGGALSVNLTLVGLSQNEEVKALTGASIAQNDQVKKISAWGVLAGRPELLPFPWPPRYPDHQIHTSCLMSTTLAKLP